MGKPATQTDVSTEITFDFTATQDYTGVQRIEVVMFNCPEWEIAVQTIRVFGASSADSIRDLLGFTNINTVTSRDSLARACIEVPSRSGRLPVLTLEFIIVIPAYIRLGAPC